MCINWFKERKIPNPDIVGAIGIDDLRTLIKSAVGDIPILLPDEYYRLATKKSFCEFLDYDQTDKYMYTGDNSSGGFDCDNFSSILAGNSSIPKWGDVPIGIVWLSQPAHAVNIFIDEHLDVWYIEPQNDKMWKVEDKPDWVPYIVWL